MVAEACESDGTLKDYHPAIGLIHNISRDHGEVDALLPQFEAFAQHATRLLVNADSAEAVAVGRAAKAFTYGACPVRRRPARGEERRTAARGGSAARADGGARARSCPSRAATTWTTRRRLLSSRSSWASRPRPRRRLLARFPGVARRFEVIGTTATGIRVVDDYAHNGEKLRAAITTAQAGAPRLLAVFQPHGFGPARFLRPELRELVPRLLRPHDRFCYAEIFYAGGTVARDLSSRMLAADLPPDLDCGYAADHAAVTEWVRSAAQPGDTVLIMGARDPELPTLARNVFSALG